MEPVSSSPYPQVPAIRPYPEPTPSSPHDPVQSGGVVYLRVVLSPEEASHLMGNSKHFFTERGC